MDDQDPNLTATEMRARELFAASVESLDPRSRAGLAAARREAVNAVRRPDRKSWRVWAPAALVASTALVAVLLWQAPVPESPVAAHAVAVDATPDSVELLANGDDFDLVENDLAFYEWLDAAEFQTAGSEG